jgi:hypothetical protein
LYCWCWSCRRGSASRVATTLHSAIQAPSLQKHQILNLGRLTVVGQKCRRATAWPVTVQHAAFPFPDFNNTTLTQFCDFRIIIKFLVSVFTVRNISSCVCYSQDWLLRLRVLNFMTWDLTCAKHSCEGVTVGHSQESTKQKSFIPTWHFVHIFKLYIFILLI